VADRAAADLKALDVKIEAGQKALSKAVADANGELTTAYKARSTDDYPAATTGRRLAFARWLVDQRNPLTARVAVNHLWARHFGRGLCHRWMILGEMGGRRRTRHCWIGWRRS